MDQLAEKVIRAKTDEQVMTQLIEQNKTFIKNCIYQHTHRFVTETEDEWSEALIAFYEAVRAYEESKGPFFAFAQMVIGRRLTDWSRKDGRHAREISLAPESFDGEVDEETADNVTLELRSRLGRMSTEKHEGENPLLEEIEEMQQVLSLYGFSFFDLTECSPKAGKTRRYCAAAIRYLTEAPELLTKMRRSRSLPIKELSQRTGVPVKVLERHRKYIIASAEIIGGEYPLLADYLTFVKKGLDAP